ncbi:hypothetical protein, partial [Escherichia coli]|uniref:hypothetical protein n=1 Tax=Escherichia coli TaxID=562 RepID=UPI00196582E7
TINEKAHICGLSCHQEPRLLCVSFYVSSPSGRCPAETANFLFLLVLSLYRPIMIGWRELNPRPKFLHTIFSIVKTAIYI